MKRPAIHYYLDCCYDSAGETLNFHDKVVLVAGGTGGLGREVTMAFLEAGARVVVTYRRAEEFAGVVSSAERIGATPPEGAAGGGTDAAGVGQIGARKRAKDPRPGILGDTVGGGTWG